jgi:YgiT-type zinc finger domain-containing protein
MICLICRQSEIVHGLTFVKFQRGKMRLIVNNVPARICPSCGEAYVEEGVTVQLLRTAEKTSEAGILDTVCEYQTIAQT